MWLNFLYSQWLVCPIDLNRHLISSLAMFWQSWIAAIFTSRLYCFFCLQFGPPQIKHLSGKNVTVLFCSGRMLRTTVLLIKQWSMISDLDISTFILLLLSTWELSMSSSVKPYTPKPWHYLPSVWQMRLYASGYEPFLFFSLFHLSITLAQVDRCLIWPWHFDPELSWFPGVLHANCNLLRLASSSEPAEVGWYWCSLVLIVVPDTLVPRSQSLFLICWKAVKGFIHCTGLPLCSRLFAVAEVISAIQARIKGSLWSFRRCGAVSMSGSIFCWTCTHAQVTWYTALQMVSHYFTDQQVVVLQCSKKDWKEVDCKLINLDVDNGFKLLLLSKVRFKMFYEKGNAFLTPHAVFPIN